MFQDLNGIIFFRCLVLFDVEGLFCPKKQDTAHDLKLFALASLTSSILIYNTLATIDTTKLNDLHFGSQIAKEFIPHHQYPVDLSRYFPTLVWAIRDQFLDLEVEEGGNVMAATADEYMEHCLKQQNGQCCDIKENFTTRKCFALPEPVEKKLMKKLDQIPAEELDQDFIAVANELLDFVAQNAATKNIIGLNGATFADAFQKFLNSIENKELNLESVYDHAETVVNQGAFEKALNSFKESLSVVAEKFPGDRSKLLTNHLWSH